MWVLCRRHDSEQLHVICVDRSALWDREACLSIVSGVQLLLIPVSFRRVSPILLTLQLTGTVPNFVRVGVFSFRLFSVLVFPELKMHILS